jgi:hypothetical protein
MEGFLAWLPGFMVYMVAGNLVLAGLKAGLAKVMDMTKTDVDNKLYAAINKITTVLDKIIDYMSANVAHKK